MNPVPLRYTVIKKADIRKYLSADEQIRLDEMLQKISEGRVEDCKKTTNYYLVVNIEEPYALDVFAQMARHRHVPCFDCGPVVKKKLCNPADCIWYRFHSHSV